MKTLKFILLLASAAFIIVSCQKEQTPLSEDEIVLADDVAVTEALFDDVFNTADNAVQLLDGYSKGAMAKSDGVHVLADSCPLVTVNFTDEMVKVVTVDYGEGCDGFYGQTRSGKIIIEVTGWRKVAGSTRRVTFDNFYFNGAKMEGVKFTENMGPNDNGNTVFMSSLTGGLLLVDSDTLIKKEFTYYREFIAGYDTRNIWDDEWLSTGSSSGVNHKGVSYERTVISALHKKRVCRFIVSGVVKVVRNGGLPYELDYGTGECDALAIIRRGDEEKEITLNWKPRKL